MNDLTASRGFPRRDRLAVAAGLAGAAALSWVYLVSASMDMYGAMDGPAAWMMHANWDGRYFILVFLMWAVMMVGMMVPSAVPAVMVYLAVARGGRDPDRPVLRAYAFAAGYLLAWTGFSLTATVLQWALARAALLSPMMESVSPVLAGTVLIGAGLYQWSSLKQACLTQCRSPTSFLCRHWRAGLDGALQLGLRHGIYCLGCCWALMLLLFVGGVMSLLWIGAIAVLVLLEKLVPFGARVGRMIGAALLAAGVSVLLAGSNHFV